MKCNDCGCGSGSGNGGAVPGGGEFPPGGNPGGGEFPPGGNPGGKSNPGKPKSGSSEIEKLDPQKLAAAAKKAADARAKAKAAADKLYKADKNLSQIADAEKRKELCRQATEANNELDKAFDEADKAEGELRECCSHRPSNRAGDDGNFRIGSSVFSESDLAPEPVEPMTAREFAERLRDMKAQAIAAQNGDLDESKLVDVATFNCQEPWLAKSMEPLSPVHLILAPDNSGSMDNCLGTGATMSKAMAVGKAIAVICDVADTVNREESDGSIYITVLKWSDNRPEIVKRRDEQKSASDIIKNYLKNMTASTLVAPMLQMLNKDVPPLNDESTMVILLTDGVITDEEVLEPEINSGTRGWTLVGIGANNPRFQHVIHQEHEIQGVLFESVLAAVAKFWNR